MRRKRLSLPASKKPLALGLVAVVFVLLIGAMGYMSILRSSSQIATNTPSDTKVPKVESKRDLDKALETIEDISLDDTLSALDAAANF